ncbi:MAG TPA: hypothetical protein VFX43_07560 [Chitinophagaceae bacterium]|nr:hypothetical protein [Chitinophagaceae bacterium]
MEVTNLPMLNEPFYALVKGMVEPGRKTAKAYFNSPGWVAFVVTNVWGYTSPGEGANWGSGISGSGWLCQVLWDHYAFTQDEKYLKKMYPILKSAATFYLYSMVKDANHDWLVTAPSESPENAFYLPDGKEASICAGPTIDNQIIRELFMHVIDASHILGRDKAFGKKLEIAENQLPPNQIDFAGRLMEWLRPSKEPFPHMRHMSPIWGLYPGNEISLSGTPKIAEAAKQLMIRRGDISTGWSLAWKINLWARLRKGSHAFKLLKDLLHLTTQKGFSGSGGIYPDLFDACPFFQIDGNFGGTSGIAEMLVQSQAGFIQFLPALPGRWPEGSFSGFCVRGRGVVSAKWDDGKLQSATLKATVGHLFKIDVPKESSCQLYVDHKKMQPVVAEGLREIYLRKGQTAAMAFNR